MTRWRPRLPRASRKSKAHTPTPAKQRYTSVRLCRLAGRSGQCARRPMFSRLPKHATWLKGYSGTAGCVGSCSPSACVIGAALGIPSQVRFGSKAGERRCSDSRRDWVPKRTRPLCDWSRESNSKPHMRWPFENGRAPHFFDGRTKRPQSSGLEKKGPKRERRLVFPHRPVNRSGFERARNCGVLRGTIQAGEFWRVSLAEGEKPGSNILRLPKEIRQSVSLGFAKPLTDTDRSSFVLLSGASAPASRLHQISDCPKLRDPEPRL